MLKFEVSALAAIVGGLALAAPASAQVIRSGTGATPTDAALLAARDAFRTDLGGGTAAGANGSFGGLRREINWDGVPAAQSAPNNLAANFFNSNSPRGAVFSTGGTGFQVSGATTDAGAGQPAAANFGNLDASYTNTFQPFTAQRLFTALGSNVMDVNFFVPGTATPGFVKGFGVVFADVDKANTTSIQLFDPSNASLGTFFAPQFVGTQGNQSLSFLGVSYTTGTLISRARITSGNVAPGAGVLDQNGNPNDVVMMDDFIYSEPVPEPATAGVLLAAGALSLRRRRVS